MEETTYEAHQRRALEEEYTPVTACYDGERIGRIAVRFKGQVGTLQNCFQDGRLVCDKLSMRLKFDERSEEHTSELQSREKLVCRLLLEKKKKWQKRKTPQTK